MKSVHCVFVSCWSKLGISSLDHFPAWSRLLTNIVLMRWFCGCCCLLLITLLDSLDCEHYIGLLFVPGQPYLENQRVRRQHLGHLPGKENQRLDKNPFCVVKKVIWNSWEKSWKIFVTDSKLLLQNLIFQKKFCRQFSWPSWSNKGENQCQSSILANIALLTTYVR